MCQVVMRTTVYGKSSDEETLQELKKQKKINKKVPLVDFLPSTSQYQDGLQDPDDLTIGSMLRDTLHYGLNSSSKSGGADETDLLDDSVEPERDNNENTEQRIIDTEISTNLGT